MKRVGTTKSGLGILSTVSVCFSFLMLTFISVKIWSPDINSDAATQTASQAVGPHTMSMANNSTAIIDITPTSEQTIYKTANDLIVSNTCNAGATITMKTSGGSNDLARAGLDDLIKNIPATTGDSLNNTSWGYSLNSGSIWGAVPASGDAAAVIYDKGEAAADVTVPMMFGVKVDSTIPSGVYTNDIVYTMTPNGDCLSYGIIWDFNGGNAKAGATYPTSLTWGQTINLSTLTPTNDGYTFIGWSVGSSTYVGSETSADLNIRNEENITVQANWLKNEPMTFSYTGAAQTWTVPTTGRYKVELWGAQGGWHTGGMGTSFGGKGGYASGTVQLTRNTPLYIYVGGYGYNGGWNGGGASNGGTKGSDRNGNGGGATDIRTTGGAWNNADSLRSRIIVAGGGGAGAEWAGNGGGAAGGLTGQDGFTPGTNCSNYNYPLVTPAKGGNQTGGGAGLTCNGVCMHTVSLNGSFGIGAADATTNSASYAPSIYGSGGGGGGWYGGGSGATTNCHIMGSAGGSSYISGHTGCVGVTSTTSSTPKSGCTTGTTDNDCSISPYGYTFTDTSMIGGTATMPNTAGTGNETGHAGNGYVKITHLGS